MKQTAQIDPCYPTEDSSLGFFLPTLLIILGSYPPLATDMYLPALPQMAQNFNTSGSTASLTLVLFFVFFAFSTLLWGPISEKFGRKPSLMAGVFLFTLSSAGCVFSSTIHQMIAWRVVQAVASGAPVTISLAIVQDTYTGNAKKKILAILGALMMVAPVVSPSIGSAILLYGEWRMIFMLLTLVGAVSLIGVACIRESRVVHEDLPLFRVFSGLFSVLKISFFRRALMIYSLPAMYVFAFIGSSSLILMNEFGISANLFSLFFGINAGVGIIGAAFYVPLVNRFGLIKLSWLCFGAVLVSGVLILAMGLHSPTLFLLAILPGSAAAALVRPVGMDPMMEAAKSNPGAASSMINFASLMVGSLGMQLVTLEWHSRTLVYGILALFLGLICCTVWPWVYHTMKNLGD